LAFLFNTAPHNCKRNKPIIYNYLYALAIANFFKTPYRYISLALDIRRAISNGTTI
jgi:hypothetical protein